MPSWCCHERAEGGQSQGEWLGRRCGDVADRQGPFQFSESNEENQTGTKSSSERRQLPEGPWGPPAEASQADPGSVSLPVLPGPWGGAAWLQDRSASPLPCGPALPQAPLPPPREPLAQFSAALPGRGTRRDSTPMGFVRAPRGRGGAAATGLGSTVCGLQ